MLWDALFQIPAILNIFDGSNLKCRNIGAKDAVFFQRFSTQKLEMQIIQGGTIKLSP